MTDWVEIIVPAAASDVDEVAALLADACEPAKEGTEVRGDEVVIWAPLADQEAIVAEVRAAVAAFAEAGLGVDPSTVRAQPALPEAEWRDAWKRYFHVTRISPRIVVVPSWETYEPTATDVVIALDPGMAFGTGTHASTRLVLEELDRLAAERPAPARVLDVGAGSGILAIAAVKLWPAATVVAVDNDPIAVAACAENAGVNAVGDRIASAATPVGDVDGQFDLVMANIQAHVLRELLPGIAPRVAPGGTLVMSGLLSPQAEAVAEDYAAVGFTVEAIRPSAADPGLVERGPAPAVVTARLLVPPARLAPGELTVDGDDYAYLFRVRRLAAGDPVALFDGAGREADAVAAAIGPTSARLTVGAVRAVPRPRPRLTVLQALIKGERMDWCLEKLVEVGVDAIVPVACARSVVRLDDARRASRHQRHQALAVAAARQCGRADLPTIAPVTELAAALGAVDAGRRLVAHPGGAPLGAAHAADDHVAILIGPEGGLAADELEAADRAGFAPVSLGPTILRAETAGVLAAAAIRLFAPPPVGAV